MLMPREGNASNHEDDDCILKRFVTFPVTMKQISSISRRWDDNDDMDFHVDEKYERDSAQFSEEEEESMHNGSELLAAAKFRRRRRRLREPAACADDNEGCFALPIDVVGESMEAVISSMETMLCQMSCLE
jgi:hypothetical protein